MQKKAAAKILLERWTHDPVLFARQALGLRVWHRQAEMLRAVDAHPRVAIRSGHKVGKSTFLVAVALWFVCTRPRARVIMTSASGRQVRSILWKELRRVVANAPLALGGTLHKVPDAGMQFSDGREILGFSTNEPEKMAGFSGPNQLYLLDEASGIEQEIFEAIEGNRAGGARLAMTSNPTQTSGEFFEAFTDKRHLYCPLHVSSAETPNATGQGRPIPGLASAEWVKEKQEEWGVESLLYSVRVKGDFARQGGNAVIPLGLLEEAAARWRDYHAAPLDEDDDPEPDPFEDERLCLGLDVAREGDDDSVLAPRRGLLSLPLHIFHGLDGPNLAGEVVKIAQQLRRPHERPLVNVDVIGVGASAYDTLRRVEWLEVHPINVQEAPTVVPPDGVPGYHSLRDQIWFGGLDWLKAGGLLVEDTRLHAELLAPTYSFDNRGCLQVEPKDRTKKRLKRSPDRADAHLLSVYTPPSLLLRPPRPRTNRWGDRARGFG